MLVVFSISIAPKSYFHDVLANHKDEVHCPHPEPVSNCIHPKAYHCHFTDLVVTVPFVLERINIDFDVPYSLSQEISIYNSFFKPLRFFEKIGRGPPAV